MPLIPERLPLFVYPAVAAVGFIVAHTARSAAAADADAEADAAAPAPVAGTPPANDLWGSFGGGGDSAGGYISQFGPGGVLPQPGGSLSDALGGQDVPWTNPSDEPPADDPLPDPAPPPADNPPSPAPPAPGPSPTPPPPAPVPAPKPAPKPAPPAPKPAANRTARCQGVRLRAGPHLTSAIVRSVNTGAKAHAMATVAGDHYRAACGGAGSSWLRVDYLNGVRLAKPLYTAATLWR